MKIVVLYFRIMKVNLYYIYNTFVGHFAFRTGFRTFPCAIWGLKKFQLLFQMSYTLGISI
jgi:hypothetical protein